MKYLVGVPVWKGYQHTVDCLESIRNADQVVVVDNDSEQNIKTYLNSQLITSLMYGERFHVICNERNLYVNAAWNQIMEYFLNHSDCDYLIILNSDAMLPPNWREVLDFYLKDNQKTIVCPEYIDNKNQLGNVNISMLHQSYVTSGVAGVCIILSRKMTEIVYPIPLELTLWFGDNYVYSLLQKKWYSMFILHGFKVYHAISQNVSRLPEAERIIEEDKKQWEIIKQKYNL